jgi:Xaa-Pro aminopeptidase
LSSKNYFEKELKAREKKLQRWLSGNELDVGIFFKEEIELVNGDYIYYGGGQTSGEYAAIAIGCNGEKSAIVHEYSYERVKHSGEYENVYEIRQSMEELMHSLRENVWNKNRTKKIAVDYSTLSVWTLDLMKKTGMKPLKNDLRDFVYFQRSIKSDYELEQIIRAIQVAARAFERTLNGLKEGHSTDEIASILSGFMIEEGGITSSFDPDVRLRRNLEEKEEGKLRNGDLVLFDFGARLSNMYPSDIGRTVPFGTRSEKEMDLLGDAVSIKKAGLKEIKAGTSGNSVREGIDAIIREHGYVSTHRPGHQTGLNVHEPYGPHLAYGKENAGKLRTDNVVTWEPGIGFPGEEQPKNRFGMAHMEDMVHVKASDSKMLGNFSLEYW